MLKQDIIRGHPVITYGDNGVIDFRAGSETWSAVFSERRTDVIPGSKVRLTFTMESHCAGENPQNVHSFGWAGLGLLGETDPLATSLVRREGEVDSTGKVAKTFTIEGEALTRNVLFAFWVEVGKDDMWKLPTLNAIARDILIEVIPPDVPPMAGLGGYPIVALDSTHPDFYVVTIKVPKGNL